MPTNPASTPQRRIPEGLRAFRHRDYRLFWFSQLLSLTGTWLQSLAQSWLVLTLTNSPIALGMISILQFGPTLVLGLAGGVIADRYPKRRILLVTQSAIFVITSILAILVVTGTVQLWNIYAAAFAFGIVNAIDMPTRQSFVSDMVGHEDLGNAVALNSALFNTTRIIGPALAGILLSTVGAGICFALNAVTYLPTIAALALMNTNGDPAPASSSQSPIDRLRGGLAYVRQTPMVLMPIVLVGLVATFGLNFNVWAPLLARDVLDIGASGFGVLMSAIGVGSLTGALTLAFRGRAPSLRRILLMAGMFGAAELALAAATHDAVPLPVVMALMGLIGFTMSTTMAQANTLVQTSSPHALRGRVMSIYMTVFAGATPLGAAVAGLAAEWGGAPLAVALGGFVALTAAIGVALWSRSGANRTASGTLHLTGPESIAGPRSEPR
ncbi:MAG: MFS transporter [Thermomicrobiales bacterium]